MPVDDREADESAPLDMLAFVDTQRRERYRAFIVHGPARSGKSAFASALAKKTGGVYIDVLATVAADPMLARKVDVLDARNLKGLALNATCDGASIVLVDEFDFLVPVWGGELAQLAEIVRKLSVTETQAVIGFFLRSTPYLETLDIHTSRGQSRVLRIDEIQGM